MLSRLLTTSTPSWDFSLRTDMTVLGSEAKVMIATLTFISKLKICGGRRDGVRGRSYKTTQEQALY